MPIELKGFQEKAVRRAVHEVNHAFRCWLDDGDTSVVVLKSPTGSGKTVIATRVIEQLLRGSDDLNLSERPTLRILWLTDNPALNRQSRDKMDRHGDSLAKGKNLVVVDEGYDEAELARGTVTFAHIQQLTRSATTWQPSEAKGNLHSLWHAIAKTVRDHGDDFLLIVDEAHKGIGKGGNEKDRQTIIRTILEGGVNLYDGATHPPAPVAMVLTATPQNFLDAMVSSNRRTPMVKVPVGAVQEEGLIKPRVSVEFAKEDQKANHTLLVAGVADLHAATDGWRAAHEQGGFGNSRVYPCMVVQVENSISRAELAARIDTIDEEWARLTGRCLPDTAFAHCFGDEGDMELGQRVLKRTPAEKIEDDTWIKVVFFKEALTTGWDCPRAEVMVSLRRAKDGTTIAQLVGRMIRTPGATHAPDPSLDSVQMYLPYYDEGAVAAVVKEITNEVGGGTEVDLEPREVEANPSVPDAAWDAISALPRYARPKTGFKTKTDRAQALACLLVDRGVVGTEDGPTPEDGFKAGVVDRIRRHEALHRTKLDEKVADLISLELHLRDFGLSESAQNADTGTGDHLRDVHARDLDSYFEAAKRKLPGGSGSWWFEALVAEGVPGRKAKLRVCALSSLSDIVEVVEQVAIERIDEIRAHYGGAVGNLGLAEQFDSIWHEETEPVQTALELTSPRTVATKRAKRSGDEVVTQMFPLRRLHLWAFQEEGQWVHPGTLNTWEEAVLDLELNDPSRGVVAWYRNPTSGRSGLAVPYTVGTGARTVLRLLYPDFVFVREIDGKYVVDILDPHRDQGDSVDKWRGLADYAAKHSDVVRQAVAIVRIKDMDWGLDLAKPSVRKAIWQDSPDLEELFQRIGSKR